MSSYINSKPQMYNPVQVQPLREELEKAGFRHLYSPQSVEALLSEKNDKSVLYVINSVCGCAAGSARPGVIEALQNNIIPDHLVTSFAGQERDAIDYLREVYLGSIPPSSPFIALFKNGEVKFTLQRFQIEQLSGNDIASELKSVFNTYCSKQGPSISPQEFAALNSESSCGSSFEMN